MMEQQKHNTELNSAKLSDTKLGNKVALITGAGQGVGQGIAIALAKQGARIAVAGRTEAKLKQTCELIHAFGGEAQPFIIDITDAASTTDCVEAVVSHFGGLNILVNNAQESPLGLLNELTEIELERGWQSGPMATFRLMKLCYPYLKGDGSIINLASSASKRWDMSGYGGYAAVKEAIRSLTRTAANEWGPDNIRSNVILPVAKSPGLGWWAEHNPEEAQAFLNTIPLQRFGDCVDDIGQFVAMMCSDESRYLNGQSIALDGGQAYLG
ncbi:SDR family NAD(P)-dependent oxidoreductase [Vibrio sinensis]|nr:SDR family oxidoreductase [Vibrio sinensis]